MVAVVRKKAVSRDSVAILDWYMKVSQKNLSQFKFFRLPSIGLSVMDRYIAGELILPFLFGMGLFTSLGLAIGTLFDLVRQVTERGLSFDIALKALILQMPTFIVLAFPMSILLASLMAYSRLSADSELIALRSIGVSIYRLIVPAIFLSIIVVALTFMFHNFIAPAAKYEASNMLEEALDRSKPAFKTSDILYPEYTKIEQSDGTKKTVMTRLFYAEEFNGKEMKGLTILDRSQQEVNQIVTAKSATWNFKENTWDFFNGTIYGIAPDGSYRTIVRFQHQQLALPKAPFDLAQQNRPFDELNIFQTQEYLKILQTSNKDNKKIRKVTVRMQEKIAFPFVCLVFCLVGAAIGLQPQNTSKATSFGICIVLIFSYYLFSFITSAMGISGTLPPLLAAWLPNIIGLGAALFLMYKTSF